MKKKKKKNQTRGYSYKLSWVKQFPKKKKKLGKIFPNINLKM